MKPDIKSLATQQVVFGVGVGVDGGLMAELIAVPLDNGGVIVVEMNYAEAGVVKAARPGQVFGSAAQSLEAALESVSPAVRSILAKLRQARPRDITVELGLMLTAEAGAVIVKSTSECHLKVTLQWGRDDGPPE